MNFLSRKFRWLLLAGIVHLLAALATPWLVRGYWSMHSSNSVRRGVRLAQDLNCFSCHGQLGTGGVPDPTATTGEVPGWSGGTWMMYVNSDEQIRQFILDGVSHARGDSAAAREEREKMAIGMPAYDRLSAEDLDQLWAYAKWLAETDGGHRGVEKPW